MGFAEIQLYVLTETEPLCFLRMGLPRTDRTEWFSIERSRVDMLRCIEMELAEELRQRR